MAIKDPRYELHTTFLVKIEENYLKNERKEWERKFCQLIASIERQDMLAMYMKIYCVIKLINSLLFAIPLEPAVQFAPYKMHRVRVECAADSGKWNNWGWRLCSRLINKKSSYRDLTAHFYSKTSKWLTH